MTSVPNGRTPLGTRMSELAAAAPDEPAVTVGDLTVTRLELDRAANRTARWFSSLGVGPGDMVTLALPNGHAFYEACLAVWKLGAVPQPVSANLPLPERRAIVELADSRLVVGVDPTDHPGRACLPTAFEVPDLADDPLPPIVSPSWKAATSGGSTGRPKLIVSTQRGLTSQALVDVYGMQADDCQLVAGPLYHSGPFVFSTVGLLEGNHLVVLERFDAASALEAIDRWGITFLMLVPTMMSRMARVLDERPGAHDLTSVRRLWHTAAPCPAWLKLRWIDELGPERVLELYGGTEGQSMASIDGSTWLARPGSVGKAVTGEMIVLGPDGEPAPPGVVGEIFMRPTRRPTYRYVGSEARRQGDWESIGDLGWMDEDGFLFVADRRTDLILQGGANVYPAEVEGALLEHPAVGSCAVVGVPDEDLGRRVHAVVHLVAPVTGEELAAFCAERIARYKVPRSWELVDQPVRDDAGKVRRSALADRASGA